MKNAIKQYIERSLGLKISKSKIKAFNAIEKLDYKPKQIEFMGLSGVGKTSLYNAIIQLQKNWLNVNEANEYYKNRLKNINIIYSEIHQLLAQNLLERYEKNKFSPMEKLDSVTYFHSVLKNDAMITYFNDNIPIVSDDGLFHCFRNGIYELFQKEYDLKNIMKNKAIIYCYSSAEVIASNIKKREKTQNQIRSQHKNMDFLTLVKSQEKAIENIEKVLGAFKHYNIPILKINMKESLEDNAQKALSFINSFQSK